MQATNFILGDYLTRIGFNGDVQPSLDVLVKLMRAQLQSVPFENLDVQAGKVVSLMPEDIVNKIVYSNRGGYCYEVNGLFAMALGTIGFEFELIGARPMFYPHRRPKSHMVLVVKIGAERWLCDTGFGSFGLRSPIGLHQLDEIIQQDNETFRLTKNERNEFVLQALVKGEWANQFGFDLYAMEMIDFSLANYYNSTHPDAVFVQRYLVMLQRPNGRTLLSGDQLKQMRGSDEVVTTVTASDMDEVLWREFHLRRP